MVIVNNKRSTMQLISEILTIAKPGVRKTRIVYGANLSAEQAKKYIKYLMDQDLLKRNDELKILKTTKKGVLLLQKYIEIEQMLGERKIHKPFIHPPLFPLEERQ